MDSNRLIELLARKMANEATPRELEELDELMAIYPDSLYYDDALKEIWAEAPKQSFSERIHLHQLYEKHKLKFQEEFETEVPEEEEVVPVSWFKKYTGFVAIACSLFLIALASLFYLNKKEAPDFDTEIVSGKGMRKKLKLPDGTLVWLNADSKLSYDNDINKKEQRLVHLTGEAFFDVAHMKNRPFIVRTNQISVKVLGTAFNVKAYDKDVVSEATLLRGSIELSVNNRSEQKILLKPSEKFAFTEKKKARNDEQDPEDISLKIENINPVRIDGQEYIEEISWKDDVLVFRNESLEDLKPRLERWFNVQIEINSSVSKSYRFTGIFKNENITEALTAMQLIKPFHFKLKADDIIIY